MKITRQSFRARAAVGAFAIAVAFGVWRFAPASSAVVPPPVDENLTATATPASFADVVEAVKPAVVNISAVGAAQMPFMEAPGRRPFGPDQHFGGDQSLEQFFRRFFKRQSYTPAEDVRPGPRAMGSGFIIDPSGLVVTNHHVIAGAFEIVVTLNDGTQLDAELVGTDAKTDLALLEVEAAGTLPYATFGDSDTTRVGDWVLAIGNPFGLGGTATTGIVSARGRDIQSGPFDDFLQIDAPINKGNSGGPLFDVTGQVIGVNTAIFSPNGGNVGIGFAIPASQAGPIVDQLREHGHVERGWLGVQIQSIDDDIAAGLGLKEAEVRGVLVASVVDGSPAAAAGLEAGDVIMAFDGEAIDTIRDLTRAVAAAGPNREIVLELWRGEQTTTRHVQLGANPDVVAAAPRKASGADAASESELGLSLAPLTADARQRYAIDDETAGVLVVGVARDTAAAAKGLRRGDVILRVGPEAVAQPADVVRQVRAARDDDRASVVFQVARGDSRQFVAVPFG